jgi:hypothetical protein
LFAGLVCDRLAQTGLLHAHADICPAGLSVETCASIAQCHIDRLNSFRSSSGFKDLIQMRR